MYQLSKLQITLVDSLMYTIGSLKHERRRIAQIKTPSLDERSLYERLGDDIKNFQNVLDQIYGNKHIAIYDMEAEPVDKNDPDNAVKQALQDALADMEQEDALMHEHAEWEQKIAQACNVLEDLDAGSIELVLRQVNKSDDIVKQLFVKTSNLHAQKLIESRENWQEELRLEELENPSDY